MPFQVTWENRSNAFGLPDRVAILSDGVNRLEVWPGLGLNAYRWQVAGHELLYQSPEFFTVRKPTRTGFPILFPFPNRIRDGRFTWHSSPRPLGEGRGEEYRLPIGDTANKNAIHGFVVNRSWRVIDQGADAGSAWITGEFHGSLDAPETLPLWPADYRLRMTYRLFDHVLRVEADADNPDTKPLPFGIGYHPYFANAPFGGADAIITVAASKIWELHESLPTGKILDVDPPRDLRQGKPYSQLNFDDVMTDVGMISYDPDDKLGLSGVLRHPTGERMLTLWIDGAFRELVLFTPAHREAFCIEPYTCTTDAINLSQKGIDAGLRVLAPGEHWHGVIEMHLAS